jgi:hypothetical protein
MHAVFKNLPLDVRQRAMVLFRSKPPAAGFNLWWRFGDELCCPLGVINYVLTGAGNPLPSASGHLAWKATAADVQNFTTKIDNERITTVDELARMLGVD